MHGRLQQGSWPAGHAGADRARQHGAFLAGAHSPRHIGERLGHDDHDPAARGQSGRCDEPKQRRRIVDPSLGHGQHPRQRGHPGRHEGRFPTRRTVLHPATHFVLAALRRGRLPQLQELHPDAGERHSCLLRPRWLLLKLGHERSMAAPVFGRMGSSRSHGSLRREQGLDNWVASIACPQRCPLKEAVAEAAALHSRDELFANHIEPEPAPEDPVAEASDDEDDAPMPDAPPEPEIIDSVVCTPDVELGALHRIALGVRRWTALVSLPKNCHLHIISHRALCCLTCPLSRVSCLFVVSPVCLCSVSPALAPRQ